jgi:NAD(P)-dependent dehydrogenase (short-subunit alcohol dehydrogenase family)
VAERLAGDGFTVVINYSGDAAPAEALARKIEDKGGRALTAKADVSNAQAVRGMFDAAEAAFGGVDVLVNNAGIMPLSTIADTDDATCERLMNVNLKGTFNTLREASFRNRAGRSDADAPWSGYCANRPSPAPSPRCRSRHRSCGLRPATGRRLFLHPHLPA